MARNQIANLTEKVNVTAYVSCVAYKKRKKFICIENVVVNSGIQVDHLWLCCQSFSDVDLFRIFKKSHKGYRVHLTGRVSDYLKFDENRNLVKDYCLTEIDSTKVSQVKRSVKYDFSRYY